MKINKELVEYLNSLKILQTSCWDENIPEDTYDDYFTDKFESIEFGLDVEKHRWYEITTEVLKMNNGFIGVRSVTDTFSESSTIEDMYHKLEFFEMEQILVTSYKKTV